MAISAIIDTLQTQFENTTSVFSLGKTFAGEFLQQSQTTSNALTAMAADIIQRVISGDIEVTSEERQTIEELYDQILLQNAEICNYVQMPV